MPKTLIRNVCLTVLTSITLSVGTTLGLMTLLYGHPSTFSAQEMQLLGISFIIPLIVSLPVSTYCFLQNEKLALVTQELRYVARHDGLTGLLTRAAFLSAVHEALQQNQNADKPGALLFIDLDHFKAINDTHGHAMGDKVLQSFGAVAKGQMNPDDLAGRLGGEEFCLFIPNCGPDRAKARALMLLAAFQEEAHTVNGHTIGATLSVGLSFCQRADDLDHDLSRADDMLYQAKDRGRNTVVLDPLVAPSVGRAA